MLASATATSPSRVVASVGIVADAPGGADRAVEPADRVGRAGGDRGCVLGAAAGQQQRELVAADPEGRVGRAADGGERGGGRAQQSVAGAVSAQIVDVS